MDPTRPAPRPTHQNLADRRLEGRPGRSPWAATRRARKSARSRATGYTLFLGGVRPFLGSVFGLLSYFMLTSRFVQFFSVPDQGTSERFYFLCVIAFAAGFSERWAQDTLTGG